MVVKRPKLKIKDRTVTEQKLIEAAEEEFSKHGFGGATTRQIANRAGMNLALIARYFDGKYGLLIAVIERKASDVQCMTMGSPKSSLTEECLSYAEFKFQQITRNVDFFRIVIGQFVTDDKFLRRFQESMPLSFQNQEFVERLELMLEQKKVIADFNPLDFIDTLERNIIGVILFDVIMKRVPKDRAYANLKNFISLYAAAFELQPSKK